MCLDLEKFEHDIWLKFDQLFQNSYRHILLAVSGGCDSMAMMALFDRWQKQRHGYQISVATVDHQLRPHSLNDALFVQKQAQILGLNAQILSWMGDKPKKSIQEKAREKRYALLKDHALTIGADCVVCAHTQDDQVETLVMRLFRGSGLKGLRGICVQSQVFGMQVLRPLLDFSKENLRTYLQMKGMPWVEDPSNENDTFERVRLRQFMPTLESMGFSKKQVLKLSQRIGMAEVALEGALNVWIAENEISLQNPEQRIEVQKFFQLPDALRIRFLERFLVTQDCSKYLQLEKIETLNFELHNAYQAQQLKKLTLHGFLFQLKKNELVIKIAPQRNNLF